LALVKSCLQKAVRRGFPQAAVAAAAYLLAHEPKELLRRLPVILAEDVGIFGDLPKLCWLMVAAHSGYKLKESDARFLLRLVGAAAAHPEYTAPPLVTVEEIDTTVARLFRSSSAVSNNGQEEVLAHCLVMRACYGGMSGDVNMCLAFAARPCSWIARMVPEGVGGVPQAAALAEAHIDMFLTKGLQSWGIELPRDAKLDVAVDFHCSDVVPQLRRQFPIAEDALKEALWAHRSSLNFRKPEHLTPPPTWWANASFEGALTRLSQAAWSAHTGVVNDHDDAASASKRPRTDSKRQLSLLRFATAKPSSAGA